MSMDLEWDTGDDEPVDTPGFCLFKLHHAASVAAATIPPGCTEQEALWEVFQQIPQHITQGYEAIARQTATASSFALAQSDANALYASSLRHLFLQIKSFFSQLALQRAKPGYQDLVDAYLVQIRVNKRYLVAAAMRGARSTEANIQPAAGATNIQPVAGATAMAQHDERRLVPSKTRKQNDGCDRTI
jgi:hypothetical protein